jgi:hypothetical protein
VMTLGIVFFLPPGSLLVFILLCRSLCVFTLTAVFTHPHWSPSQLHLLVEPAHLTCISSVAFSSITTTI